MRSDRNALKLLLSLIGRYGEQTEGGLRLGDLLAEDKAILSHYLGGQLDDSQKRASDLSQESGDDESA